MHEYPEGNISAMHYVGLPPDIEETTEPEVKKAAKKKVRYFYYQLYMI